MNSGLTPLQELVVQLNSQPEGVGHVELLKMIFDPPLTPGGNLSSNKKNLRVIPKEIQRCSSCRKFFLGYGTRYKCLRCLSQEQG